MRGLITFFASRPLLVNLILVMLFLSGFVSLRGMVVSSYPALDTGIFYITTVWPGAAATDVELSVTVPLEEEILEIEGLDKLRSASMEGQSSLLVQA
ncbi:efflux RND transporter permease subunit, partial [Litorivivens sp.]